MVNASSIQEHMEVVGACGIHVGTVDRVEGGSIKLAKNDPGGDGQHHYIPLDWVESVGQSVRLTKSWEEARDQWHSAPIGAGG